MQVEEAQPPAFDLDMASSSLLGAPPDEAPASEPFPAADAGLNLAGSLLFGSATNDTLIGPDLSASSRVKVKEVKLFDGSVLKLKPKRRRPVDLDFSGEKLSSDEMNGLFKTAETLQAARANQKQLAAQAPPRGPAEDAENPVWTEKYRPKRYVELCSVGNDKQYRQISHWLRKWSGVVFKHDIEAENVDMLGRPLRKFLLVHGPPGIGKTAAVHVIVRQMGYAIQELNAANSMDTLPQVTNQIGTAHTNASAALKLKIKNALTTNTISSKGRPTCLVIDEVDTAINSSEIIRVLSDLQFADQRTMNKASAQGTFQKSKSQSKDFSLNRPIICIANDVYSTNTRSFSTFNMDKLRSMSESVAFKRPAFIKKSTGVKTGGKALASIKDFLMLINDKENLGLDYQKITEIVEVCEGDLRACINHLQFNGRKIESTESMGVASKDMQISWFNMADMLFKRDPQLSREEDFDHLLQTIVDGSGKSASSASGTLDKVIRSCFQRYLDVVYYKDDSLVKPADFSDWLDFYDKLGGHNDISHYASLVNMKIWSLFSELHPKKSDSILPDARALEIKSNEARKKNKALIKSIGQTLPLTTKVSIGGGFEDNEVVPLYVAQYINQIIFPTFGSGTNQPKSKSALSDFDKQCLEKSAALAKSFNIELETYRDMETNQVTLEITPDLDSLTLYDTELTTTPYATALKKIQAKRSWLFPLLQGEFDRVLMASKTLKRHQPQDSEDKTAKKSKMGSSVEFFKSQYAEVAPQSESKPKSESGRIWVKFNEGYSNAVRRNIGWEDLWRP